MSTENTPKILDLIPENLRPQLIQEVAELLKKEEDQKEKEEKEKKEIIRKIVDNL